MSAKRVVRQVAPARIADANVDTALTGAQQPGGDASREALLVPAVAGEDDVDVGRIVVKEVGADDVEPHARWPAR